MKWSASILTWLACIAICCTSAVAPSEERSMNFVKPTSSYNERIAALKKQREVWKTNWSNTNNKDSVLSVVGHQLHSWLEDSVFVSWYGTAWDFNGYTDVPGQGQVACGYFVSTPLKHVGFNLNRFKVAQQYSHSIVKTLCNDIQDIQGREAFDAHLKTLTTGLYIVGLDNHVGFISVRDGRAWFIHSSYVTPVAVVKELAYESVALHNTKRYILGALTTNKNALRKWLNNEPFAIIP